MDASNGNQKKAGRPKMYTAEEIKEHRNAYNVKYLKERYNTDPEFRRKEIDRNLEKYYKNKNVD